MLHTLNVDDPTKEVWNFKRSGRYFCDAASFLSLYLFSLLSILLTLFLKLNSTSYSSPNFQSLRRGRLLQRCPLLVPINLWWERWLITREQEKIRPLGYWWFIIHFWGVNRELYLSCQCLIYIFRGCTKSPAVFGSGRGVNGRSGGAGQTWPSAQDGTLLLGFLCTLKWSGYTACG